MRIFLLIVLLLILASCSTGSRVIINKSVFEVELASTPESRALGLMYRESLEKNNGMLFIFDDENERGFWMKNTKIPLGMVFISKDKKVVNVITAQPCLQDSCATYPSNGPSQYVLEVNAGEAENIKVGDSVSIRLGNWGK